jgi:hypothetical protein
MALTNATPATSDMIAMTRTADPLREEASATFFVIFLGAVQCPARSSDAASTILSATSNTAGMETSRTPGLVVVRTCQLHRDSLKPPLESLRSAA